MADYSEQQIDQLFYALSDSTRRQMLLSLSQKDSSISELGKPFEMSKQSISKHIKILEQAGLINKEKNGRIQKCQFKPERMEMLQTIVDQYQAYWEQQFDQLEDYINKTKK